MKVRRKNSMAVSKPIFVFVCFLFVATFALADHAHIDYDHSANFSKYRTFTWLEKPQTDDPFMADRIVQAVNGHLRAKGLEPVTEGGDLGIRAALKTEQKEIINTYYDGFSSNWNWWPNWGPWPGWGPSWNGPGWATTYVDTYIEGTTIVDLIDTQSSKPVWRGTATEKMSHKPEKASKEIAEDIKDMFEDYPPVRSRISD